MTAVARDRSVLVTIPEPPCRHGKRWAKKLKAVAEKAKTGHDYDGPWLECGEKTDLEIGDVVVAGGQEGSLKNGNRTAHFYVVCPKMRVADKDEEQEGWCCKFLFANSDQWAIECRTDARKVLAMPPEARVRFCIAEYLASYYEPLPGVERLQKIVADGGAYRRLSHEAPRCYHDETLWEQATEEQKAQALAKAQAELAKPLAQEQKRRAWFESMLHYGEAEAAPAAAEACLASPSGRLLFVSETLLDDLNRAVQVLVDDDPEDPATKLARLLMDGVLASPPVVDLNEGHLLRLVLRLEDLGHFDTDKERFAEIARILTETARFFAVKAEVGGPVSNHMLYNAQGDVAGHLEYQS